MSAKAAKKERAWTRVSTVANTLENTYNLEQWAKRNVVLGIAARPDLYALATSVDPDDKDGLKEIVKQAEEAAKARSAANLGTALHRMTERIDRGVEMDIPEAWKADLEAYCNTLVDHHIKVNPDLIERVVILSKASIAGTFDRIVTIDGVNYIADLKTGKDAPNYPHGYAVQLALYANADHMWKGTAEEADRHRDQWSRYLLNDPDSHPDEYELMPDVDKERALLIHLPVGEARCGLHWVDIAAGREAALIALKVRDWRKRKDLSYPLTKEVGELLEASLKTDDW